MSVGGSSLSGTIERLTVASWSVRGAKGSLPLVRSSLPRAQGALGGEQAIDGR
jgi:hypothetical protein